MKARLDQLLVDRGITPTIDKARAIIGAGEVYVNDTIADKPGSLYLVEVTIRTKERCIYVSRGGLKLEKGLSHFDIKPENLTCIDIGASSGGFTDCLLQNNAKKVFAVDVAYGQLAWKIRQDPRVIVIERFNARKITPQQLNEPIDLAVIDASFISLTKLLLPLIPLFRDTVSIVALVKPQFELPKIDIGEKGVISDPELHQKAISKIEHFVSASGLTSCGVVPSPLLGPKGNREFLIHIVS